MGNKTRAAQQAHRRGRSFDGVPTSDGRGAYTLTMLDTFETLKAIDVLSTGGRTNVPDDLLRAAFDWLWKASKAPAGQGRLCMTCEAEFSRTTRDRPAWLAVLQGRDIIVSALCLSCGADKTTEQACAVAEEFFRAGLFKGDLSAGAPGRWERN